MPPIHGKPLGFIGVGLGGLPMKGIEENGGCLKPLFWFGSPRELERWDGVKWSGVWGGEGWLAEGSQWEVLAS